MQLFLDDGTILCADAWALTRVDPKGKVKNIPGLVASPIHPLSAGGAPPAVLSRGRYSYQIKRLDAATLTPLPAPASADFTLDDGRLLLPGAVVSAKGAPRFSLEGPRARSDAVVSFGPRGDFRCLPYRARDGALSRLLHTHVETVVCVHDTRVEGAPLVLQVTVSAPSYSVLDAWPDRDGVTLACWLPQAGRAAVARVDRSGRETARVDIAAITLPVVDGARVVAQPDARTVRSTPLDGSAPTDLSVDAISRAADARSKAPAPRDNAGPGMLLAWRGRTLLVPWHGETLLDLDQARCIDRKLPAKYATLRACVTAHTRDRRDALLREGYERLTAVRESAGRVGFTFWRVAFDRQEEQRDFAALIALADAITAATSFTISGYGSEG